MICWDLRCYILGLASAGIGVDVVCLFSVSMGQVSCVIGDSIAALGMSGFSRG